MTFFSVFPVIIIGVAVLFFAIYSVIYFLRINKKIKKESSYDKDIQTSEKKSIRMPDTESTGFAILVIAVIACIVVCFVQLNSLKKELQNINDNYSRQMYAFQDQLDSNYSRLEQMLTEVSSLFNSFDVSYGEYEKETHTALVTVKVTPKVISDDTKMTLTYFENTFDGKRKGNSFVFDCRIDILYNIDENKTNTLISVTSGGQTKTQPMPELDESFLYYHFLPSVYACSVYPDFQSGRFSYEDVFSFSVHFENNITIDSANIVFEKNGEVFKTVDVSSHFKNAENDAEICISAPSTKDFPLFCAGDELKIYLVARDSVGVTHTCYMAYGTYNDEAYEIISFEDKYNEVLTLT